MKIEEWGLNVFNHYENNITDQNVCLHFISIVHFRHSTNNINVVTTCLLTLRRVGLGLVEYVDILVKFLIVSMLYVVDPSK